MSLRNDLLKYNPRPEQIAGLDFITNTHQANPDTKFYLLDMPVGSGKSHLALMIADWYTKTVNKLAKIDIITAGKILQDQYDSTYESVNNLKGKENYDCNQYDCSCGSGKEFNKLNKTTCQDCPYDSARNNYISGRVSLTNFHLYLIYALYSQGIMDTRESNVLIVDEAHQFDQVMSDFISIKVTEGMIKKLKFTKESDIIKRLKRVSNIQDYVDFLSSLAKEIEETITQINQEMVSTNRTPTADKRELKISKFMGEKSQDVKLMQTIADLKQFAMKIELFLKEWSENPDNWVLEKGFNEKTSSQELSLEPLWAFDYLEKFIWSKYDAVFLMSGTILDKHLFCELNGLEESKCVYYSVDSSFPVENRPIYYFPLGKMSYAQKEETFKKYVPYLHKFMKKYEGKKGIIHTNSFELSNWIKASVDNSRFIFHDSTNKEEMLRKHFESPDPTVFVSPSVGTGVSFDHEKSRFQVIAKIPYPSLASQKNKYRQKQNPDWYAWRTISDLIQMSGRSIRSKTDWADTIIIDSSFGDILRYSTKFLPKWFQDAIKRVNSN